MPLEMWFRDDLANMLLSLNVASAATARVASGGALAEAHRQGFEEALKLVALALGITPTHIMRQGERRG